MGSYSLKCPTCNLNLQNKYVLGCEKKHGLLKTVYRSSLNPNSKQKGIWKYIDWLPLSKSGKLTSGPMTIKSRLFSEKYGYENVFYSFNGYWPEKKCDVKTCSFKEYEAMVTIPRIIESGKKGTYLASTGNTARAFAYVAAFYNKTQVIICIPKENLDYLWLPWEKPENVKIIALDGYDYSETISFSSYFRKIPDLISEGGAKNVARRDGMAVVVYDYYAKTKNIPNHYFQGVGSGTGGIAAWEAITRLKIQDNLQNMSSTLHLSQNYPFIPLVKSWNANSRVLLTSCDDKNKVNLISAKMLSNRNPPYGIKGGIFDVLTESGGKMYSVNNKDVKSNQRDFKDYEGIDIVPESGVAVSSLIKCIEQESLSPDENILINITGGGFQRMKKDYDFHYAIPDYIVNSRDEHKDVIKSISEQVQ